MNLQQYLTLNPSATLADAKLISTTRNIQDNEIVNFDAQYGISEIMLTIINDPSAAVSLKKEARIFNSIVSNGRLSADLNGVNVFDPTTQYALNEFVIDGRFTQVMRNALENKCKVFTFANTTQAQFDSAKALITLATFPTQITVTNPANSSHILNGRPQELHTIYVTILPADSIAYADNLIATAASKNITYDNTGVAIVTPFLDSASMRGTFNIPANWSGTKAFVVNKSGLENHILYKLQSKYNRVFTAEVKSLV